jgi:hypothetical protein
MVFYKKKVEADLKMSSEPSQQNDADDVQYILTFQFFVPTFGPEEPFELRQRRNSSRLNNQRQEDMVQLLLQNAHYIAAAAAQVYS